MDNFVKVVDEKIVWVDVIDRVVFVGKFLESVEYFFLGDIVYELDVGEVC